MSDTHTGAPSPSGPRNTREQIRTTLMFILLVGLLIALTGFNYRFGVLEPGGNDFLTRWNGARAWLLEGRSPYDPAVTLQAQRLIYGRPAVPSRGEDVAQFVYPMHSMLLFAPLALLSYPVARALWMTLLEAGLVGLGLASVQLVGWRPRPWMLGIAVGFALFWYNGLRGLIDGNTAVLVALAMVTALLAVQRHSDLAAGLLLGLSTIKPQMAFLLLPFVLAWSVSRRRWGLMGWTLAFSLLLPAAFLLVLPDWPLQMLRQMLVYPSYNPIGSPVSILAGLTGGFSDWVTWLLTAALSLYLLWEWANALRSREDRFLWASLMTLAVTSWVAYRTATTNYVVLLPVVFLLAAFLEARGPRQGTALALAWLVFMFVLGWMVFLTTLSGNLEQWPAYLPLPVLALATLLALRGQPPPIRGRQPG